jgi:hypothetical protein
METETMHLGSSDLEKPSLQATVYRTRNPENMLTQWSREHSLRTQRWLGQTAEVTELGVHICRYNWEKHVLWSYFIISVMLKIMFTKGGLLRSLWFLFIMTRGCVRSRLRSDQIIYSWKHCAFGSTTRVLRTRCGHLYLSVLGASMPNFSPHFSDFFTVCSIPL